MRLTNPCLSLVLLWVALACSGVSSLGQSNQRASSEPDAGNTTGSGSGARGGSEAGGNNGSGGNVASGTGGAGTGPGAVGGTGGGPELPCATIADCPVFDASPTTCPDGSVDFPEFHCVDDVCAYRKPCGQSPCARTDGACEPIACATRSDCPAVDSMLTHCLDGTTDTADYECRAGTCVWRQACEYLPFCTGRPCGARCHCGVTQLCSFIVGQCSAEGLCVEQAICE